MAADLDVLIKSSTDPLLALEYHRHFTHSLLFIPVGALVCTLLLRPLFFRMFSWKRAYLYAFLTRSPRCLYQLWHAALLAFFKHARRVGQHFHY